MFQTCNTNPDSDGLHPIIHFVDHNFTACALWRHQKAFTCNSRSRFQLQGNFVQTKGDQEEAMKINYLNCL